MCATLTVFIAENKFMKFLPPPKCASCQVKSQEFRRHMQSHSLVTVTETDNSASNLHPH